MLLAIIPQGSSAGVLDLGNSANDAVYRLGLQGQADLAAADWIGTAELLQFADDAVKALARRTGLFLVYDAVAVTAGTALYTLSSNVFTIFAVFIPAAGAVQIQRITSVRDLFALDATWSTTTGNSPTRVSFDAGGPQTATLYPVPVAGGTLGVVGQEYPSQIQVGATHLSLQAVLQDYFTYAMLAGALGKESEHAVPEMAAHYRQRMALYEQVVSHLWGAGR